MSYRSLKSVFHRTDKVGADTEEKARRSSPAAINWDFRLGEFAMFCMVTPEVAVLLERIMTLEYRAQKEWLGLARGAQQHYLSSMIIEEIQATNAIESVQSTRQEVSAALEALSADNTTGTKRFTEMARLYVALGEQKITGPTDLDEIRNLYDSVTAGEIRDEDRPDGDRFRRGTVSVSSGNKVVHTGVVPEAAISDGLTQMLAQSRDDTIPLVIRAVVSHLIFENVHPFYDGNGRTGRFLLALDLGTILSPVAWLSLSATIADNKDQYYRAFVEAEHPLNRGDATPFVVALLEIVAEAQHRLMIDLTDRHQKVTGLYERIGQLDDADKPVDGHGSNLEDDNIRSLLFVLGQAMLFAPWAITTLGTLAVALNKSTQFVRPRIQDLVDDGLVQVVTKRPLRFRLTSSGCGLLGLDVPRV